MEKKLALSLLAGCALVSTGACAQFRQFGVSQYLYSMWSAQDMELSRGTVVNPVSSPGPLAKLSRMESLPTASCKGNQVDNECNATLVVYSTGLASSGMQPNAINAAAIGYGAFDAVGIAAHGDSKAGSTGIGTGAYFEGRREIGGGNNLGAEIRSTNLDAPETFNPSGYNNGALWLTAGGTTQSAAGAAVGYNGVPFDVGFGVVRNAAVSVAYRDDSSAITSHAINGTHSYGVDASGMTVNAGGAPFVAPLLTPASSSATCKAGSIEWDANFLYVCTATNTWKRAVLSGVPF